MNVEILGAHPIHLQALKIRFQGTRWRAGCLNPAENKTRDQSNVSTVSGTVITIHYELINLRVWQLFSLTLYALTGTALWKRFYFCGFAAEEKLGSIRWVWHCKNNVRTMCFCKTSDFWECAWDYTASARIWPGHYRTHSSSEVYAKEPFCYIT